jgi:hypothetical protein
LRLAKLLWWLLLLLLELLVGGLLDSSAELWDMRISSVLLINRRQYMALPS